MPAFKYAVTTFTWNTLCASDSVSPAGRTFLSYSFIAWTISCSCISLLPTVRHPYFKHAFSIQCDSWWWLASKKDFLCRHCRSSFLLTLCVSYRETPAPSVTVLPTLVSRACRLLLLYSNVITNSTLPGKIRWMRRSEMAEKGLDIPFHASTTAKRSSMKLRTLTVSALNIFLAVYSSKIQLNHLCL